MNLLFLRPCHVVTTLRHLAVWGPFDVHRLTATAERLETAGPRGTYECNSGFPWVSMATVKDETGATVSAGTTETNQGAALCCRALVILLASFS